MNMMMNARDGFVTPLLAVLCLWAGSSASAQVQSATSTPGDYVCVERGPDSKVWQRILLQTNQSGVVRTNLQSYTELATGLCYLQDGQYVDSVEEVEPVAGGAQAIQGRHQVRWSLNANNPNGAVTLTTPDGKKLTSTVFGMAYYDVASGSNAALARLQDCNGSIVAPNHVLYADAFSNLRADVQYTYRKAGLSQDIVLRQSPPAPDRYGLSDETTILQVYTEFFDPPLPEMTAVTNGNVVDHQVLDFGEMKIGLGQALFLKGQDAPLPAGMVTKQWIQVNGRTFLIEAIPYPAISNQLQQLPQASNLKPGRGSVRRVVLMESNPSRSGGSAKGGRPMKVARAETAQPRLMVDYDVLSSTNNLTLQGDTTYLVSGMVNVTGTAIIEGGTVVKYTNSGSAEIITTNVVCETGPYRPGVFTSMNDNSVGSVISNSTGAPSIGGATYLNLGSGGLGTNSVILSHLRCSYAYYGVKAVMNTYTNNVVTLWDSQFINCENVLLAIADYYTNAYNFGGPGFPVNFYNVLFSQCAIGVNVQDVPPDGRVFVTAQNVTADQVGTFVTAAGSANGCTAAYSIFTGTGTSGIELSRCCTSVTNTGIYQTAGAGNYYLADGSTNRGWGITNSRGQTNIPSAVLADLQTKTTYPPTNNYTNVTITTNLTLAPRAQRDTNGSTVDLGYHYDPIDYLICGSTIGNRNLTVQSGTVIALFNGGPNSGIIYGLMVTDGASLSFQGTATDPIYFVTYDVVQEQTKAGWLFYCNGEAGGGFVTWCSSMPMSAQSRFTIWSTLNGEDVLFSDECLSAGSSLLTFQDCQFYNGCWNTLAPTIYATNCLFQRMNMTVSDFDAPNALYPLIYNNLFWAGSLNLQNGNYGTWTFHDNLFDYAAIGSQGAPASDNYNGYVTTNCGTLTSPVGTNDVILTNSPAYETGTLGVYYYPTNLTNVIHRGSRSAPAAGLYHYTVTTNNVVEATNKVSIGFHYVACGTNDLPLVSNTNSVYDYLADTNGSGLILPGEIPWIDVPTIITPPVSVITNQGATVTFSVAATVPQTLSYQWYFNLLALTNATNPILTLTNVQPLNQGGYYVVVTNLAGSATSSTAALIITNQIYTPTNGLGAPGILINCYTNSLGLQINALANTTPLPFVTVANSYKGSSEVYKTNGTNFRGGDIIRYGTVARILVGTNPSNNPSQIVGEYYSAPEDQGGDPSRTTVDRYGNVWVGNRAADGSSNPMTTNWSNIYGDPNGNGMGSVTEFGVVIGGTRGIKTNYMASYGPNYLGLTNWTFIPDTNGHYLQPPFIYNTCVDRDGDGLIHTSLGVDHVLHWGTNDSLVNGLSNAWDEAIIHYVKTMPTGVRSIPIDGSNGFWAGSDEGDYKSANGWQEYIDTITGMPVTGRRIYFGPGGYGGVVGGDGTIWSEGRNSDNDLYGLNYTPGLLRFVPQAGMPAVVTGGVISSADPDTDFAPSSFYGIGIDPRTDNPWLSGNGNAGEAWFSTNGSWESILTPNVGSSSKGILVDANGNVWMASGDGRGPDGQYGVYHILTSGDFVGFIDTCGMTNAVYENGTNANNNSSLCGNQPYGISMDSQGMVWTVCYGVDFGAPSGYGYYAMRIDPTKGPTTNIFGTNYTNGQVVEVVDLGYEAQPYDYSDMTGYVALSTTQPAGVWDFVQDSGATNMLWSSVAAGSTNPPGSSILTEVRADDRITGLPSWPFRTVNGSTIPRGIKGRYLEVRVNLLRSFGASQGPTLTNLAVQWSTNTASVMQITNQPQNAMLQPGATVTFSVGVSITNVSYQWRTNDMAVPNGGNIYGATTATLTVSNAQYSNASLYSVSITDTNGTVLNSAEARLHILGNAPNSPTTGNPYLNPPSLSTSGDTNTFTATAVASPNAVSGGVDNGATNVYYQWRLGQNPIAGAAGQATYVTSANIWTATLNVTNAQCTNGGDYSVIFWNQYGEVLSQTTTLTVNGGSTLTIDPPGNIEITTTNYNLTLTATPDPPCFNWIAAQWFITVTGEGTDKRPIPGATNFSYLLPTPITCASIGTYEFDVFDQSWAPHSATKVVSSGDYYVTMTNIILTLNPSTDGNPNWSYSNQMLPYGATTWTNYGPNGPTLTMMTDGNQDGYSFQIVATQTNSGGGITNSASVAVSLNGSSPDAPGLEVLDIQNGTLNVTLTAQPPPTVGPWTNWSWTYQALSGPPSQSVPGNDDQFTITNVTCTNLGFYTAQVIDPCGNLAAGVTTEIDDGLNCP
jgi:hypothetical protein